MKTCIVYRTKARGLKQELERDNYNQGDEPQFEAAIFSDGRVAQRWLTLHGSCVWWDTWEALCRVHIYAHPDYGTRVVWSDGVTTDL